MVEYLDQIDEKKSDSSVQVHDAKTFDAEQAYEKPSGNIEDITGAEFDDPNLDPAAIGDYEDDSPYPEVRAAVANTDDPTIPVNTWRAWVIGIAWAILIPGLNQLVLLFATATVVHVADAF